MPRAQHSILAFCWFLSTDLLIYYWHDNWCPIPQHSLSLYLQGKVDHYGTYEELVKSGVDFAKLVTSENQNESKKKSDVNRQVSTDSVPEDMIESPDEILLKRQVNISRVFWLSLVSFMVQRHVNRESDPLWNMPGFRSPKRQRNMRKRLEKLEESIGESSGTIFAQATRGASWAWPSSCVSLRRLPTISVTGGCRCGEWSIFFNEWYFWPLVNSSVLQRPELYKVLWHHSRANAQTESIDHNESYAADNDDGPTSIFDSTPLTASVFFVVIFGAFFMGLVRSYCFFRIATNSSISLHDMMYRSVTRSPIRFFDTNPKGWHGIVFLASDVFGIVRRVKWIIEVSLFVGFRQDYQQVFIGYRCSRRLCTKYNQWTYWGKYLDMWS